MMKNFRSIAPVILSLCFAVCLFLPAVALADPPQEVALAYAMDTQTLTVSVTHKSTFTSVHYVKQIVVKKNGVVVSTNDYKSQPDKKTFDYTFQIPAAENDLFEVSVTCNIQGSKTATLKVGALAK